MLRARGTHFQIPQLVTMSNNLKHAAMDSCLISSFLGLISMGCLPLLTPRQMRQISDPANIYCRSECKNTLCCGCFLETTQHSFRQT